MQRHPSENVQDALRVLGGAEQTPKEALKLSNKLKRENHFSLARRILGRARTKQGIPEKDARKLIEQHALCTYKDPDLLRSVALDEAWTILSECTDLAHTNVKETLGIAGAICKRRFELYNQKYHLEQALDYYLRGYNSADDVRDFGYTGINAAFVLDYLAHIEQHSSPSSESARQRREQARAIREALLDRIEAEVQDELAEQAQQGSDWDPRTEWWLSATFAETHLGLARLENGELDSNHFESARSHLEAAMNPEGTSEWERESTVRQLARLAWLHVTVGAPEEQKSVFDRFSQALLPLTPDPENADHAQKITHSLLAGRVGLALSGGGFRASLFHIGVLARLAELDVLRQVEVLSCVSGGSILGAHYYLKLRKLLKDTPDTALTQPDLIKLVDELANDFLAGVQRNIRTRVFRDLRENVRMMFGLTSRTLRLGELYETELYSKVKDEKQNEPRYMTDLLFDPSGWKGASAFNPNRDNWQRAYKVPTLILNATTLNTGHNWQFTASWMGEPPEAVGPEVDTNERLRRMYYDQAPAPYRQVRLGHAVAASSCVPGLFEPVSLSNLYQRRCPDAENCKRGRYTVELVDGGVHDNQGVSALLGQNCDTLLVSDASGQMQTDIVPKDGILPVALRANNILMKRVRTAEFEDLKARERSGQLRDLMFLHLRADLDPDPEDWVGCQDPWEARDDVRPPSRRGRVTAYGILRAVQDRLAAVRTDLDSFSTLEARALMLSGYRMAAHAFEHGMSDIPQKVAQHNWSFFSLEQELSSPEADATRRERLLNLLEVSRQSGFKIWRTERSLKIAAGLIGIGFLVLIVVTAFGPSSYTLVSTRGLALSALGVLIGAVVGSWAARLYNLRGTMWKVAVGLAATVVGTVGTWIHLRWFDPWFLRTGDSAEEKQESAGDGLASPKS